MKRLYRPLIVLSLGLTLVTLCLGVRSRPIVVPIAAANHYPTKRLVFAHEWWHEGAKVLSGRKYVLRTDLMYRSMA